MIRVLAFAFGLAIVASLVTGGNRVAIWAGFLGGLALAVAPLLTGQSALKCPACRKRIKLGATACHHCGRAVGA